MANVIRINIKETYERLCDEIANNQHTGVTSDDLSKEMDKGLPAIEGLAKLQSNSLEPLRLAYDLVLVLKTSSYGDLDGKRCGVGDRPSDESGDQLLASIISMRLARGDWWHWEADLNEISREAKKLIDYGIEPWYPKTRRALRQRVGMPN